MNSLKTSAFTLPPNLNPSFVLRSNNCPFFFCIMWATSFCENPAVRGQPDSRKYLTPKCYAFATLKPCSKDRFRLIRHTVCRFLEERGYAVESASNGADALELLKEIHPDILITDLMMPKMDGGQLITEVKKHPSTTDSDYSARGSPERGRASSRVPSQCHYLERHRYRDSTGKRAPRDVGCGGLGRVVRR